MTNEQLAQEVHRAVQVEMTVQTASERLSSRGFVCDRMVPTSTLTCMRTRMSMGPTCIDRVYLTSSSNATLSNVDVRPMACAGL
ncbi:hypothetical protein [uncultured Xylophilus sp.]|uniref:hypothetical protein n=1 Tax=uncultured Xylophilus sp. TaxID=296832 RepID=UPI0025F2FB6F|nr:hypothetical protein [uncultured Xylophilus sp.]